MSCFEIRNSFTKSTRGVLRVVSQRMFGTATHERLLQKSWSRFGEATNCGFVKTAPILETFDRASLVELESESERSPTQQALRCATLRFTQLLEREVLEQLSNIIPLFSKIHLDRSHSITLSELLNNFCRLSFKVFLFTIEYCCIRRQTHSPHQTMEHQALSLEREEFNGYLARRRFFFNFKDTCLKVLSH